MQIIQNNGGRKKQSRDYASIAVKYLPGRDIRHAAHVELNLIRQAKSGDKKMPKCKSCKKREITYLGKGLCKTCYSRELYHLNPERRKAAHTKWRKANKDKCNEYAKRYWKKHKEKNRERMRKFCKEYWKKNPDKYEEHKQKVKQYFQTEQGKEIHKRAKNKFLKKNPNYFKDYGKKYRRKNKREKIPNRL